MLKKFVNLIERMDRHEVFVTAPAIAYATALSLAPFVLILLSIFSFLGLDFHRRLSTLLTTSLGGEVGATVEAILDNAEQHPNISGLSGLIGLLVLFFSASIVISQLRVALDKINEYKTNGESLGFLSFIRSKFWAIGLILGFAFLSIVSLLMTATINLIYPDLRGVFWLFISYLINLGIFSILFSAIYRFVPTKKQSWKSCLYSGFISGFFFLAGKGLISLYLAKAGLGSPYGAAGSLIVFLAWVYFTALTLLTSYEISLSWLKSRRHFLKTQ